MYVVVYRIRRHEAWLFLFIWMGKKWSCFCRFLKGTCVAWFFPCFFFHAPVSAGHINNFLFGAVYQEFKANFGHSVPQVSICLKTDSKYYWMCWMLRSGVFFKPVQNHSTVVSSCKIKANKAGVFGAVFSRSWQIWSHHNQII